MLIQRQSSILTTARVKQLHGLFDVPPAATSCESWTVDLKLPEKWNVGVIIGPSGSGKSTIAGELFGKNLVAAWPWPADKSILDGFPPSMGIKDITGLLSSVGFSSPPAWVRPFRVLSNGQQFRVNLARTLAELPDLAVVDEFTSVVDRQVAQIGSAAVAKTVRRRNQKFIAVTCHYDVLDWLEPDWIYEANAGKLEVADATRGSVRLRQRPPIELEIVRVRPSAWHLFKGHHYLSADINQSAACFVALLHGTPVAFAAVLPFPHPNRSGWRGHRTVCLPDFQGVGIGNALSEFVASLYAAKGKPYYSRTSSPSMIRHRTQSLLWRTTQNLGLIGAHHGDAAMARTESSLRFTAGFEYIGPADRRSAIHFGLTVPGRTRTCPAVQSQAPA